MDTDISGERYLRVTKKFLLISGIWPGQNKAVQYICRFIIGLITMISIVTQVARLARSFCLDVLVEQLPFILVHFMVFLKQGTYIVNDAKLGSMLTGMFNDWKNDRSKEELAILSSYMDKGSFLATIYLANAYGTTAIFVQLPWWPRIADIVMPLNTSRPRGYIIPAYYPLDEDRYYYLIIFQMTMEVIVLMFVFIACDTCFIYSVQHACGLFAMCGYRFKEAIRDVTSSSDILNLSDETYKKVCRSAQAHTRAMTFVKEFEEIHFGYLLICLASTTIVFSGTLAMISQMHICPQFYECLAFLIVQVVHLFLLTVQGQFVSNSNWQTYNEIYEGMWYLAVPKTQVLYLQALRAALSAPQITAGRRIPMNLETFASIIKASVSYFTMLKSA